MKKTIELENLGQELCRIGIDTVLDSLINYLDSLDNKKDYIKDLIGNLNDTLSCFNEGYNRET